MILVLYCSGDPELMRKCYSREISEQEEEEEGVNRLFNTPGRALC